MTVAWPIRRDSTNAGRVGIDAASLRGGRGFILSAYTRRHAPCHGATPGRRQAGKLLAIADGQSRYVYPVWQVREGETLPGLEAVLGELTNMSALDKAHFMTSPDARLDGKTPLNVLRSGDIARVCAAARAYGTQGAA